MAAEKPFHTIVLDAGPIIRGEPGVSTLLQQCEQIISTPAVITEIRDESTRSRISTSLLPFLVQRNPKPDSVKTVTDFARKTGDLVVLSRVDIQLLALSYELECERNGGNWRLRRSPGQKGTNGPPPSKAGASNEEPADDKKDEQNVPAETSKLDHMDDAPAPPEIQKVDPHQESCASNLPPKFVDIENQSTLEFSPSAYVVKPVDDTISIASKSDVVSERAAVVPGDNVSGESGTGETAEGHQPHIEHVEAVTQQLAEAQLIEPGEDDDVSEGSDSEGWITPSNLKRQQEKDAGPGTAFGTEPKSMQVVRSPAMHYSLSTNNHSRPQSPAILPCKTCFYR
jgi:RNA-binding protein NOB1